MHRQRVCKYSHCPKRETKDPHRVCEWKPKKHTHTLSYIRAASQVRIINGVSEVEAQLNAL